MIYSSKNEDSYKSTSIIAKCGVICPLFFPVFFRGSHQNFQSGLKQGFFSIFGGSNPAVKVFIAAHCIALTLEKSIQRLFHCWYEQTYPTKQTK